MYDVLDQQTDYAILAQLASSPGKFHVARQPAGGDCAGAWGGRSGSERKVRRNS